MLKISETTIKALPFDFEKAVADFIALKKAHIKTVGVAAPSAHDLVEKSVLLVLGAPGEPPDFVKNYEIVPLTLDERKLQIVHALHDEATQAIAKIIPPLKSDLWNINASDAYAVEEKKRTPEHKKIIADHSARVVKTNAIARHMAQMKSDIHDLTESTIDGWKAPPFPT